MFGGCYLMNRFLNENSPDEEVKSDNRVLYYALGSLFFIFSICLLILCFIPLKETYHTNSKPKTEEYQFDKYGKIKVERLK
jgi:polyferredoxin